MRERHRDAAMAGARERERATGGHIWSRGPRGSQVTLASDGASRFHDDVLAHALASLYLGVPPFLSPRRSFPRRLPRTGHQKYLSTVVPRMRETRWDPRMRAGEKRYFEIIGDCRLSGIVPIVSIPDIERVFNFTSRLAMIFTISGYRSRIFVEFHS